MFQKRWITAIALLSFSALADVSFEEKQNRVEFLEELSKNAELMNIDDYRRELTYEKMNLPLEERAANEANLLAERIKIQITKAFEASMNAHGDADRAIEEIRDAIEKDLELTDPALREELKQLALKTLETVNKGESSHHISLEKVERELLKGVESRANYLNKEGVALPMVGLSAGGASVNLSRDAERKSYNKKSELLQSLVSDREDARWTDTAHVNWESEKVTSVEGDISLRVKVEFLGAELEAGPAITFGREYSSVVTVEAEGLTSPVVNGNFDFWVRDRAGRIVNKGGKDVKRFMNFDCTASMKFSSEYTGEGGFSYAGIGGGIKAARNYSNSVKLVSRKLVVPETVEGVYITPAYLVKLCHNDFLKTRITNTMTVAGSLNQMMKGIVASLRFSHPKTQCVKDSQCLDWFRTKVIPLTKMQNYPRCVEERREKFHFCEVRGLKGQNCPVIENGKRTSDGMFEYACDEGLKCVKYQNAGWFTDYRLYQYAKGACMPINPKTYRGPVAR